MLCCTGLDATGVPCNGMPPGDPDARQDPIHLEVGLAGTMSRPVSTLLGSLYAGYIAWRARSRHTAALAPPRLLPTFGTNRAELRIDPWDPAGISGPSGDGAAAIRTLLLHCARFPRVLTALADTEGLDGAFTGMSDPPVGTWRSWDVTSLCALARGAEEQEMAASYFLRSAAVEICGMGHWASPVVSASRDPGALDRLLAGLVESGGITIHRSSTEQIFRFSPVGALAAAYLRLHHVAGIGDAIVLGSSPTGMVSVSIEPPADGRVTRMVPGALAAATWSLSACPEAGSHGTILPGDLFCTTCFWAGRHRLLAGVGVYVIPSAGYLGAGRTG